MLKFLATGSRAIQAMLATRAPLIQQTSAGFCKWNGGIQPIPSTATGLRDADCATHIRRGYSIAAKVTSKLGSLSKEQIHEAFNRASEKTNTNDIQLVLVTEPLYDAVINFLLENYVAYEPIINGIGRGASRDDFRSFFMTQLRYNMSMALINADGEMVSACIVSIDRADKTYETEMYKDDGFKLMLSYLQYCSEQAKFYECFDTEEAVYINAGASSAKYRNMGLGGMLGQAILHLIEHLGIDPIFLKGEGSSNFSKRLFEKNGFETLYEKRFDEYTVDGKVVINTNSEHQSMKVYGKRIVGGKSGV